MDLPALNKIQSESNRIKAGDHLAVDTFAPSANSGRAILADIAEIASPVALPSRQRNS